MNSATTVREIGYRSERRATGLVTLVAAVAWTATTAMILPGLVAASETSAPTDNAASDAVQCEAAAETSLTSECLGADVDAIDDPCEDEMRPLTGPGSEVEPSSESEGCKPDATSPAENGLASMEVSQGVTTPTIAVRQFALISDQLAEHAAAIAWYEERIAELEQRLDRFEEIHGRGLPAAKASPQTAATPSEAVATARNTGSIKRPVAKSLTPLGSTPAAGGLPRVTTGPVPGVTSPAAAAAPTVSREVDKGAIRTAGGEDAKLEILGVRQVDRADRSVSGPTLGRATP